jgi:hypothetical protein
MLDAFRYYIANESDGRGFVLVGHSPGAALLNQLITGVHVRPLTALVR